MITTFTSLMLRETIYFKLEKTINDNKKNTR